MSALPEGWVEKTLGEVANILGGFAFKGKDFSTDIGIPIIKIKDIRPPYVDVESANRVNIDNYNLDKVKKFLLSKGDFLIAMTGATIGKVGRMTSDTPAYLNQRVAKVDDIKGVSHKGFLYHVILSDNFEKFIDNVSSGSSAQQNVSATDIGQYPVLFPPLPEQKAIADMLSSFDEKIELLREQNKTLETLAQTIFKEWFVNFNYPAPQPPEGGDGGKSPSGDLGAEMVDSELGEIPKGWRVGKLGDVTSIKGGGTPSTKNEVFWNGDIHWTSPKDLSNSKSVFLLDTEKKLTPEGLKKVSSGLLPKGTLLLSSRAPIGYIAISNVDIAINQGYIAMLDDADFSNYYMLFWLKTHMRAVTNAANGSTFLEISKSAFRNIDCVIPSRDVLKGFDEVVEPTLSKVLENIKQIHSLSKTRDTLLPKLMGGKLLVSNCTLGGGSE